MKKISVSISLLSVIFNTFLFAKQAQANPPITNVNGKDLLALTKSDLKSTTLITNQNDFLNNIQLNSVNINHPTYQNKITKVTSEKSKTILFESEFKTTFKDVSSSFTSNYGPVSRAPDESLKHCTAKACLD